MGVAVVEGGGEGCREWARGLGFSAEGGMGVPAGSTRLLLLGAPVVVAATSVSSFLSWLLTSFPSFLSLLPLESLDCNSTPRQHGLVASGLDTVPRGECVCGSGVSSSWSGDSMIPGL